MMKKTIVVIAFAFLFNITMVFAQEGSDTTQRATPTNDTTTQSQPDTTGITDLGVAVAPSSLKYRVKPGETKTEYVTITNDTYKPEKFRISFADYEMNNNGAVQQLPIGIEHEYGLSRWISASPTFVELAPGEKKKVAVTVSIPDEERAYRSAWALMMIDQTKEKQYLAPSTNNPESVVMGVIPVFGFGVYIFQNPPNVAVNKVEITDFKFTYDEQNKYVTIVAKNVGDGLGFSKAYVELTNLNTGKTDRLLLKQFTIFPGMERTLEYQLPGSLEKGSYSVLAVLDFGSEEELEAAELEFTVE